MPYRKLTVGAYSTLYATDIGYLVQPSDKVASSADKVIIGCHGHGGNGYQYGVSPLEPHATALVNAGFIIFGIDHARINAWGDPDAMRAFDDAYTYVTATLGFSRTKVGAMGWSMGGLTALNWIKRNPTKMAGAWLWNPATDLRYWRDAAGAYTPAYSNLNGAPQGGYTTEINTTYASSSAAVGAFTIPAAGGTGITMAITTNTGKSFADGSNSGVVGLPQATINGVAFTYTSKTDSSLIGCLSTTGSSIAVTNGMAVTSAYATQSNGYRVQDEVAQWTSGPAVQVCQASDDTTVPPGQNLDATNGFIARAGGSVTRRNPNPTGDHTLSIGNVPTSEVVAYYQSLSW